MYKCFGKLLASFIFQSSSEMVMRPRGTFAILNTFRQQSATCFVRMREFLVFVSWAILVHDCDWSVTETINII
jgi:hypothetical protein